MAVKKTFWLGLAVLIGLPLPQAGASGWRKDSNEINVVNRRLRGKIVDHTANHGVDKRIWSRSLFQRRDLYVYLPPGFCPDEQYPIIMLLHGFAQDEQLMFTFAPIIDDAIACGKLPPLIVACPDGSLRGEPCFLAPGSFFLNTRAGDFEDFVLCDVWDFLIKNYPIRAEREAHILAGVSMGGCAAYNLGIRHRNAYGVAIGIFPPLNLRWVDDHGNYRSKFDPHHWGWRTEIDRPHEPIARFGLITLRLNQLIEPLFGRGDEALMEISRENPIELVDRTRLQNGDLAMYVGYAGRDEFNIDAQVESFLYLCKHRGITVAVGYDPIGQHDMTTARRLLPDVFRWLTPLIAPYAPPLVMEIGKTRRREARSCVTGACAEGGPTSLSDAGAIGSSPPEALPPPTPKEAVPKRLP